jgi:hypothetical protein
MFDYQSCGTQRYLRFGHVEVPIWVKELGDIAPEMPAAQTCPKSDRLSSEAVLGTYLRFQGNQ